MNKPIKIISFILTAFMISGCSVASFGDGRTTTAGLGTSYESRADVDKDMPVVRFAITIQFEERADEGVLEKVADALKNITSVPQTVVASITSPERIAGVTFGKSRRELHIPFEIDNPNHKNLGIKINLGDKIEKELKKKGIDATVSIGKKDQGINLQGMSVEIIQVDTGTAINFSDSN